MAFNLIEVVQSQLSPGVVEQLGRYVGADPATTRRALGAIAPALVGGLAQHGSTPEGASRLFAMATGAPEVDPAQVGDPALLQLRGQGMLGSLFGGRLDPIADTIGRHVGIDGGGASRLMGLLAPLALGQLGRHVRAEGLDVSGLQTLMGEQKGHAVRAMPEGLSGLAATFGLGGAPDLRGAAGAFRGTGRQPAYESRAMQRVPQETHRSKWAVPAILAIVLLALFGILRARSHRRAIEHGLAPQAPAQVEVVSAGDLPDASPEALPPAGRASGVST